MALQLSMTKNELEMFVDKQLSFFSTSQSVANYIDSVLNDLDICFQKIKNKYYHQNQGGGISLLYTVLNTHSFYIFCQEQHI